MIVNANNMHPDKGLPSLEDMSLDHVITDPPYSKHVHGNIVRNSATDDLGFDHLSNGQRQEVAKEFARLCKRWCIVFTDHESSHLWREDLVASGMRYIRTGVWIRGNTMPQKSGDRPAVGHECIVICHGQGERLRWNGGGHPAVWRANIVKGKQRLHTAQKPIEVIRDLVLRFTDEGDLVADPYAGVGTTGRACKNYGRKFIGWEADEGYSLTAKALIDEAPRIVVPEQQELF